MSVLVELKGILQLDDLTSIKGRLTAIVATMEESHTGSTTSMVSDIAPPTELGKELHDILEQSNTGRLSDLFKTHKSVASIVLDPVTGTTVLHRAVELGNSQIVDLLMQQIDAESNSAKFIHNLNGEMLVNDLKSKLNSRTRLTGYTPLHFAVSASNDRVVAELLKRGADADVRSSDQLQVTPFLLACELGHEMAVRLMIKATQARCVDSADAQGNSGLHLAAENGHVGIVQVLVSVMPQLAREENKDGKTPVDLATECGHAEIAEIIEESAREAAAESSDNGGGIFFG